MNVRFLNARDDVQKLAQFRSRTEFFVDMLEDGQQMPQYNCAAELAHADNKFIGAIYDGVLEGYFKLERRGLKLFDVHVILAPEMRGGIGQAFLRKALALFYEIEPKAVLTCTIPTSNQRALMFSYAAGFQPVGIIRQCFYKQGKVYSKVVLEKHNA